MDNTECTAPLEITVLIVDDSLVFRRFLRDIFEDCQDLVIVDEARNGIEALDMVLKTNPSVILLDLEMPLMDGMTALQHLMIHRPTPTIMFSSLTEEGTARSFDTMKNGAVDFIFKDFIFQRNSMPAQKKALIDKVRRAAGFKVKAREPFTSSSALLMDASENVRKVIFCEECGGRVTVDFRRSKSPIGVKCPQCGDSIEIVPRPAQEFRENTFITVIGGGEGSFFNLLEIIPRLDADLEGAIIAVIHQEPEHLNRFTEYLDAISAMKVLRAREGINIEGGNCYIASGNEYMHFKPYSTHHTLQRLQKAASNDGAFDMLLASVSTYYKKRTCGIILSGDVHDGAKGMAILVKNGGMAIVLDGSECYCRNMGAHALDVTPAITTYDSEKTLAAIKQMHNRVKSRTGGK